MTENPTPPVEAAKDVIQETGQGKNAATPFFALTGVTLVVAVVVALILAVTFLVYFLS